MTTVSRDNDFMAKTLNLYAAGLVTKQTAQEMLGVTDDQKRQKRLAQLIGDVEAAHEAFLEYALTFVVKGDIPEDPRDQRSDPWL